VTVVGGDLKAGTVFVVAQPGTEAPAE
jgi:hypothetical protein